MLETHPATGVPFTRKHSICRPGEPDPSFLWPPVCKRLSSECRLPGPQPQDLLSNARRRWGARQSLRTSSTRPFLHGSPFSCLSIYWRGRSHPEWSLCGVLVQAQPKSQVRTHCQRLQHPQAQHGRTGVWEAWLALGLPPRCSPCVVKSGEESWPDPASRRMTNSPTPVPQIPPVHCLSQHTHTAVLQIRYGSPRST